MKKVTKALFSAFLLISTLFLSVSSVYALDTENITNTSPAESSSGKVKISGQNIATGSVPLKSEGFQIAEDGAELSFVEKDESKKAKIVVLVDGYRDFFQSKYSSVKCFFKGIFGKDKCQ